jgi:hypothetical protein
MRDDGRAYTFMFDEKSATMVEPNDSKWIRGIWGPPIPYSDAELATTPISLHPDSVKLTGPFISRQGGEATPGSRESEWCR